MDSESWFVEEIRTPIPFFRLSNFNTSAELRQVPLDKNPWPCGSRPFAAARDPNVPQMIHSEEHVHHGYVDGSGPERKTTSNVGFFECMILYQGTSHRRSFVPWSFTKVLRRWLSFSNVGLYALVGWVGCPIDSPPRREQPSSVCGAWHWPPIVVGSSYSYGHHWSVWHKVKPGRSSQA